jgi:23S rRNA G2069 N7-methylase RlmK/C1962 C5-methylase RlmI
MHRRWTAVGVDLDMEVIDWCIENNINNKVRADGYSRISLFQENVLQPLEAN